MKELTCITIPAPSWKVRSLCWRGDSLLDYIAGQIEYHLDGTSTSLKWGISYPFNRSVALPDGSYSVVYDCLGTKAVILKGNSLIREINRSYYHADVYEYPIAIFKLPGGRPVIAHCPDEYCKLEIEDAETGERLTTRTNKPTDFFHSRLQTTPDGKFLVSAGWVWHPVDVIRLFNVEDALKEPELLDGDSESEALCKSEAVEQFDLLDMSSAAFHGTDQLVWTGGDGENHPQQIISIYDLQKRENISTAHLEEIGGTLMAMDGYVVDFYDHPKLLDLKTGKVLHRWSKIQSGKQVGCIIRDADSVPPIAMDGANKRFAVAEKDTITVIQLG